MAAASLIGVAPHDDPSIPLFEEDDPAGAARAATVEIDADAGLAVPSSDNLLRGLNPEQLAAVTLPTRPSLILAGVGLSALASALQVLALAFAPNPYALAEVTFWLMGGLADRAPLHVALAAPPVLLGGAIIIRAALGPAALDGVAAINGMATSDDDIVDVAGVALAVGGAAFEAGDDFLAGHAGLDDLQRDFAADGLVLLCTPDETETAFAENFLQAVAADVVTLAFAYLILRHHAGLHDDGAVIIRRQFVF